MPNLKSTCYFFGTFNPVHHGHLLMASQALVLEGKNLGFTSITFVPAGNPPHRQGESKLLPAKSRLRMVERAIADCPRFEVCDLELQLAVNGQLTYTHAVLEALCPSYSQVPAPSQSAQLQNSQRIHLLMGQDSFLSLPSWHHWPQLLKQVHFLVQPRPGALLTLPIFPQGDEQAEQLCFQTLQSPQVDISGTKIRSLCQRAGKNPQRIYESLYGLVPEAALAFLVDNGLYHQWLDGQ